MTNDAEGQIAELDPFVRRMQSPRTRGNDDPIKPSTQAPKSPQPSRATAPTRDPIERR